MIRIMQRAKMTLLALCLVGCGDGGGDDAGVEATFSSIQSNVLSSSCALSGCHNSSTAKGSIDLSAGAAYSSLVGAKTTTGLTIVIAGDAGGSRLIEVLEGTGDIKMPPSGELSSSTISAIRQWIDGGAAND